MNGRGPLLITSLDNVRRCQKLIRHIRGFHLHGIIFSAPLNQVPLPLNYVPHSPPRTTHLLFPIQFVTIVLIKPIIDHH